LHPYYPTANATEEFFVRRSPLYEVVGQLGMWGVLINGIQAAGLEHKQMKSANWSGAVSAFTILFYRSCIECKVHPNLSLVGFLFAYTAAMFILYTVSPLLYRSASSVYYNLSLLSSDFFGLLFGTFFDFTLSEFGHVLMRSCQACSYSLVWITLYYWFHANIVQSTIPLIGYTL
jgi:solute carrier family 35, member F1/2